MDKLLLSGLIVLGAGILIFISYGVYQLIGSDLPLIIKTAFAFIITGFVLTLVYVIRDRLKAIKEEET